MTASAPAAKRAAGGLIERDVRQASKESSPAGTPRDDAGNDDDDNEQDPEVLLDRDLASRSLAYDEKHITFFAAVFRSLKMKTESENAKAFIERAKDLGFYEDPSELDDIIQKVMTMRAQALTTQMDGVTDALEKYGRLDELLELNYADVDELGNNVTSGLLYGIEELGLSA